MKNKKYIFGALIAAIGIFAAIFLLIKKIQLKKKLTIISNAGYETAQDINFPLRKHKPRKHFSKYD